MVLKNIQSVGSEKMSNFYNRKHSFEFVFPIENLKLIDRRTFIIGKVKFFKYSKYQFNKSIRKVESLLNKNIYYIKHLDAKKNVIENAKKLYGKNKGKICAVIEKYGYVEDAYFKALSDVKTAVDVIKLYRNPGVQDDNFLGRFFGIEGEVVSRGVRAVFIKALGSENYRPTAEVYGSSIPFKINLDRITFMKENGFNKINTLLKQKKYNALDKRIISAINWYGRSFNSYIAVRESYRTIRQRNRIIPGKFRFYGISEPERLLYCIIALEGLLLFSNKEPKEKSTSIRIAKILDGTVNDNIVQNVGSIYHRLYKIRSDIVHGGRNYIDKKDLNHIFYLTQNTIFSLIEKRARSRIKTVSDFRNWLK